MRLIKTSSRSDGHLETEEFQGTNRPLYAILSHTWSDGEVLFADLKHPDVVRRKKGYSKIQLMLRQAAQDGIPYAWVDTWYAAVDTYIVEILSFLTEQVLVASTKIVVPN